MKDERSSPRTFYVCKGTEGSSGTAARLLHIIALGGFVDLRLRKKKKQKTTRHEQEKQWLAAQVQKYYEETQQQIRNTDKRHKGQQISGRPLQCFASKEEKTHYGYGSTKIRPLQLSSRREHPITVRSPKDHHLPSTLSLICSCMDIRSGER